MTKSGEIKEYSITRVILILMVLFGHILVHSNWHPVYGGVTYDQQLMDAGFYDSILHQAAVKVSSFIYQFHMPVFLALSGALFRKTLHRYNSFATLLRKKAARLLIPYVAVCLCYSSVIKYFPHTFVPEVPLVTSIVRGQLLLEGNNYLWYLWSLFGATIAVYLINRLPVHPYVKLLFVFLFRETSHLIPGVMYFFAVENVLWVYSGFLFEEYREDMNVFVRDHKISVILTWLLMIAVRVLDGTGHLIYAQTLVFFGMRYMGMYAVYGTAVLLCEYKQIRESRLLHMISDYGMPIYLYSDPLNYLINYLAVKWFGIEMLAYSGPVAILLTVKFLCTLFIPILIGKLLRKLHIPSLA